MEMNRIVKAALLSGFIVLGWGASQNAEALGNPDTMVITVTPGGVNYSVTITSPEVQGYDFALVNVGDTTISTKAIRIQNTGNIGEYFSLGIIDTTGGGNAWANSTSAGGITYAMQALLVTVDAEQPANASFAGASNNVPATPPGTAANRYGQGTTKTMPGDAKDLWLQLNMPTSVNEFGQHSLVLSVNGQSS
jgi:hypothetical protein